MPRVDTGEVELEYEVLEPDMPATDTLLLIMGLGSQLVHWPDGLVRELLGAGYRVVRFDNRDSGLSTALKHLPPIRYSTLDLLRWRAGARLPSHYSLKNMAQDTVALMDRLGLASAHVVGASMGGMIGQELMIHFPQRVRTASLIMTTSGARAVGHPRLSLLRAMFNAPASRNREDLLHQSMDIWRRFQGRAYPTYREEMRPFLETALDRSYNPGGFMRQYQAIMNAEDRVPALRGVNGIPTLVLHGSDDPLIHVSGGRSVARAIPGARLVEIDGWGHDFPTALHGELADHISGHVRECSAA